MFLWQFFDVVEFLDPLAKFVEYEDKDQRGDKENHLRANEEPAREMPV